MTNQELKDLVANTAVAQAKTDKQTNRYKNSEKLSSRQMNR